MIERLFSLNALTSFWGNHAVFIGLLLILTLSLNLINGYTGLFSLGHHGFWAIGAYVGGYLIAALRPADAGPGLDAALLLAGFLAGGLAAAAAGLLVGVPCLRLRGDYLAVATLGFGEIVRVVINNIDAVGGPAGMRTPYLFGLSGRGKTLLYLVVVWVVVGLTLVAIRNIVSSYHGRAMRSISQDETAARLTGVNVSAYKVLSFVIGAGLAGTAGVLYGLYLGFFTPQNFSFMQGVALLIMVVLGGLGNLRGTIVATAALYLLPELLRIDWIGPDLAAGSGLLRGLEAVMLFVSSRYMIFYALLLIALMIARARRSMRPT